MVMRITLCVLFVMLVFVISPVSSSAQEVNADLLKNSTKYQVEMKGGSAIPKWQFGPYALLKGKYKWSEEATRSALFQDKSKQKKVERAHFILECKSGPQLIVNVGTFSDLIAKDWAHTKDFEIDSEGWISFGRSRQKVYVYSASKMASIMTNTDDIEWQMVMLNFTTAYDFMNRDEFSDESKWKITSRKTDVSGVDVPEMDFLGVLTNGEIEIRIKPNIAIEDTDGILPSLRMITEFYLGNVAVAALEITGLNINDRTVYTRQGLEKDVEQALAASIMVLMLD